MRILITGGAGYIGAITTRLLVDAGHDVVVLDSLEKGHAAAVDERAEFIVGDLADCAVLDAVMPGVEAVVHFAGYIEVAESQLVPARYFRNNVANGLCMLEAMGRHGVDKLVFSSTAAVYGEPATIPITENAMTIPVNAYGESKLMFERMLDWFASANALRAVRLRYFNVAGAWPDGSLGEAHHPETHLIPRILTAMASGRENFEIFGADYPTNDGTCIRDYIHVVDLARAHGLALDWLAEGGAGGVFNLGNGQGFSNLEVMYACAHVTGTHLDVHFGPRRPGDPVALVASNHQAERILGWRPERTHLAEIVGDAWRWHLLHPLGYDTPPGATLGDGHTIE